MAITDSIRVAGVVGVVALAWAVGACGSVDSPASGGKTSDAGGATYGASACGGCVKTACTSELSACGADPECAKYLECLDACPLGPDGNVDPTCPVACPKADGSAGKKALGDLTLCRSQGPGAKCASCGVVVKADDPILHQTCVPAPQTNKCFQCEDEKCCQTEAAEMGDPEAKAIITCAGACSKGGGKDCIATCAAQHPNGVAKFVPLEACMFLLCAAVPACNNNTPLDPCVKCGDQNCANSYANLYTGPDGFALLMCSTPCNDSACNAACEKKYPAAALLFEDWAACVASKCSAECG